MKIKFGSIVVNGRGKVGGQVFTAGLTGAILRNNAVPVNRSTTRQVQARAKFSYFSSQWANLTTKQRDQWREAVQRYEYTDIFGDVRKLSGKLLFQKVNQVRELIGLSLSQNVPAEQQLVERRTGNQFQVAGAGRLGFLPSTTLYEGNTNALVYVTPPLRKGRVADRSEYRLLSVLTNGRQIGASVLGDPYQDRYGLVPLQANISVLIYQALSDGRTSISFKDTNIRYKSN